MATRIFEDAPEQEHGQILKKIDELLEVLDEHDVWFDMRQSCEAFELSDKTLKNRIYEGVIPEHHLARGKRGHGKYYIKQNDEIKRRLSLIRNSLIKAMKRSR